MDTYIYTPNGIQTTLQISHLGNIPSGNFELGRIFLVKNITTNNITVTVIMPNGEEIETILYPGWNPEIVKGVKGAGENQLQYGY